VEIFRSSENIDIVTNVFPRTYPKGFSVEVVSTVALGTAIKLGLTKQQTEHVTSCFYEKSMSYNLINVSRSPSLEHLKLSIDTLSDFMRVEKILGFLGEPFHLHDLDAVVMAYENLRGPSSI